MKIQYGSNENNRLYTLSSRTRGNNLSLRDRIRQHRPGGVLQPGVEARIPIHDTHGRAHEVAGGIAVGSPRDAYGRPVLFLGRRAVGRYPEHEPRGRGGLAAAAVLSGESERRRWLCLDANFARGSKFRVGGQLGERMALLDNGGRRSGDIRQLHEHDSRVRGRRDGKVGVQLPMSFFARGNKNNESTPRRIFCRT